MNWHALSDAVTDMTNSPFDIESATAVSGGDIHTAYHLHTAQGDFFLKTNQPQWYPLFETEANSLETLTDTLSIRVPKVITHGLLSPESENSQAWLLLEYLPLTTRGDDAQRGKDLALLHHQIHPDKRFGWFEDNYIGHTLQPNDWADDWITFYGEQRLKHQLTLAQQNGAPARLITAGERLIASLPQFFRDYQPEASPLHGDLWGGNSAFTADGDAVFFDPASYYGDREADLAMTELFGGFSAAFYEGYNSVFPLDTGYAQRKDLYNLYHLLNHFNLFGGGYGLQAETLMQTLLKTL
ncbi:MAG: fructosamine kinase family protein [Hydrogenovibrio sp.]